MRNKAQISRGNRYFEQKGKAEHSSTRGSEANRKGDGTLEYDWYPGRGKRKMLDTRVRNQKNLMCK